MYKEYTMKYYHRGDRAFSYMSELCLVCVPVLTPCTWAAEMQKSRCCGHTIPTWGKLADRNRQSLAMLQWPNQLMTMGSLGITITFIITTFLESFLISHKKCKAQRGHITVKDMVQYPCFYCFPILYSASSLRTDCFLPWSKGQKTRVERKGKSPSLRSPNSYTNIVTEK